MCEPPHNMRTQGVAPRIGTWIVWAIHTETPTVVYPTGVPLRPIPHVQGACELAAPISVVRSGDKYPHTSCLIVTSHAAGLSV